MAKHQHDPNAAALWIYFQSIISWVKAVFPRYRRDMKGVAWGGLYDKYHANAYDAAERRLRDLREALRVRGDGGRPHHAVGRGRAYGGRELPDALPHVQSPQVRQVNEEAWILI